MYSAAQQMFKKVVPKGRELDVLPVTTLMVFVGAMMCYSLWHNLATDPDIVIFDKERRRTDWLSQHPDILKESQTLRRTPYRAFAEWGNQHFRNYTENLYSDRKTDIHFTSHY